MAERKSFLLRLDPALLRELEGWAQSEFRSLNGQIEFLLRQSLAKRKGGAPGSAPPVLPPPAKPTRPSEPEPLAEPPPIRPHLPSADFLD